MATVPEIISDQQAYASSWVSQANGFINQVAHAANTAFNIDFPDNLSVTPSDVLGGLTALNALRPTRPTFGSIDTAVSGTPPSVTAPTISPVAIPGFAGAQPTLDFTGLPSPFSGSVPAEPSLTDPALPSEPTTTLPTAPVFASVSIPPPPSIVIPEFTATAPIDNLVAPTNNFSFAEQQYQSVLLDELKAKLLNDLQNGGYGIEPSDEQALFERARAREEYAGLEESEKALRTFAQRGFPLEPGEAALALSRAAQSVHNKLAAASREIMLERSRLYVENRQFTIREARELETVLINYHNSLMERSLNAAKAVLDAGIAIFNTTVARYNALMEGYRVEAQVFESKIRAAAQQIEIYKSQIEAANLTYEGQRVATEVYRAQLAGLQSVVDLYKARVDAVRVVADVQRLKIEGFRGRVDAYTAQVQANQAQFQAYEAKVRGQVAIADSYRTQVEAFRAQVEAAKAQADVNVANANAVLETGRVQLLAYQAAVDAFRARVEAQARAEGAKADQYRADAQAVSAIADAYRAGYSALVMQLQANGQYVVAAQNAKTERARGQLAQLAEATKIRLAAAQFGSTFYQNLLAAAIGSINTLAVQTQNS